MSEQNTDINSLGVIVSSGRDQRRSTKSEYDILFIKLMR